MLCEQARQTVRLTVKDNKDMFWLTEEVKNYYEMETWDINFIFIDKQLYLQNAALQNLLLI